MSNHIKYPKIHTSLPDQQEENKKKKEKDKWKKDTQWCVTEKVHGANFSFYIYHSGKIACGKRTGFIQDNDDFFGYYDIVERLRPQVYSLASELFATVQASHDTNLEHDTNHVTAATSCSDTNTEDADPCIILFGELFGGGEYPGAAVLPPREQQHDIAIIQPVQTGVFYSPRLEFMLFDICCPLFCVPHHASARPASVSPTDYSIMYFLPFNEVLSLAAKYNIFCSEPLMIGSLVSASSFNINFPSTIPARLGLPSSSLLQHGVEHADQQWSKGRGGRKEGRGVGSACKDSDNSKNHAEGVVIRQFNGPPISSGDISSRPMLKLKTHSFRDGEGCPPASSGQEHIRQWLLSQVAGELGAHTTRNLLASACSKVGSAHHRHNWSEIVACVLDDLAAQCDGEVFAQVRAEIKFKVYNLLASAAATTDNIQKR